MKPYESKAPVFVKILHLNYYINANYARSSIIKFTAVM